MISLQAEEQACGCGCAGFAGQLFEVGAAAMKASRILDFAEFCGMQDDGNGGQFELWNLRKPLGPHPVGSTVTRATLEKYLFAKPVFGAVILADKTPDLAAIDPANHAP